MTSKLFWLNIRQDDRTKNGIARTAPDMNGGLGKSITYKWESSSTRKSGTSTCEKLVEREPQNWPQNMGLGKLCNGCRKLLIILWQTKNRFIPGPSWKPVCVFMTRSMVASHNFIHFITGHICLWQKNRHKQKKVTESTKFVILFIFFHQLTFDIPN